MRKVLVPAIWVLLLVTLVVCGGPEPDVVHGPARATSTPISTAVAQPTPTVSPTPSAVPTPTIGAVPTPSPRPALVPVPEDTPEPTAAPTPVPTPTPVPEPPSVPSPSPAPSPIPTATATPTPEPSIVLEPDSFVVVAPNTLRAGYTEQVSASLFNGDEPAARTVRVALYRDDAEVSSTSGWVEGVGSVDLFVPQEAGSYELEVWVDGVEERERAPVEVEDAVLLLVETDKPIYKPGQTVHIRVMTLDTGLKPLPSDAVIEVQDAKGIKVLKKEVATDDYGMATVDLPLSTEPNLGVWKLTAITGDQKTKLDVRVEEYVLPKYEVLVETERQWVLEDEPIDGTVKAEYSFGKPVLGEAVIVASRYYVGKWEEYARLTIPIDGNVPFELPPVGFVSGMPEAGGAGERNPRRDGAGEKHGVRGDDHGTVHSGRRAGSAEGDT